MPRAVSIAANGDVRVTNDADITETLTAAQWTAQGSTTNARTFIANWLSARGFPSTGVRVSALNASGLTITTTADAAAVTNWWMGGRL